jgi:hypothetical protein
MMATWGVDIVEQLQMKNEENKSGKTFLKPGSLARAQSLGPSPQNKRSSINISGSGKTKEQEGRLSTVVSAVHAAIECRDSIQEWNMQRKRMGLPHIGLIFFFFFVILFFYIKKV